MCTHVCYVCVCGQACLKKLTHSLGTAEWGQVCRVPAHLAGIVCACARGSIWGLVWDFSGTFSVYSTGSADDDKRPVKLPKSAPGVQ